MRFKYTKTFPKGDGTFITYREASTLQKFRAIVSFQKVRIGEWQANHRVQNDWPSWLSCRFFADTTPGDSAAQFHRNWAPIYQKFRGDKGKVHYLVELSHQFSMCVWLVALFGEAQASVLWLMSILSMVHTAVVSPYATDFASNSNELIMRILRSVVLLLPLMGYGSEAIPFERIGSAMMSVQMTGLLETVQSDGFHAHLPL